MIQMYKYVTGKLTANSNSMFPTSQGIYTGGHSHKIHKQRSRLKVRQQFFTQRIVDKWNSLSDYMTVAQPD